MLNKLKKSVKKIIWDVKGGYKPREFWENWSRTFTDDSWQRKILPQHEWILDIINKEKPKSILEIGCGFGRNIKFLIDNGVRPESITGVDISAGMIRKAKKYIRNKKVKLRVADCLSLPFSNKAFDFVLVHAVFMHIKPGEIEKAVEQVKRVSNRHIIVIEQNYHPYEDESREYTFVHDYEQLFKKENLRMRDMVSKGRFGYFYFLLEV